jgi:hypothetical protein
MSFFSLFLASFCAFLPPFVPPFPSLAINVHLDLTLGSGRTNSTNYLARKEINNDDLDLTLGSGRTNSTNIMLIYMEKRLIMMI